MSGESVSDLLKVLVDREKIYRKAKDELNEIQKKLHGLPYVNCNRIGIGAGNINDMMKRKLTKNTQQKDLPVVKRGRGRPKKNREVHMVYDDGRIDNYEDATTPGSNVASDYLSSCDTCVMHEDDANENDAQCDNFKDAMYKYINENLYIENNHGKCYDVHSLELRGWYNPYSSMYKWI
jgi:hypothetical protein